MIAYFPDLFEDELLYSLFARFYAHSGHLAYIYCAEAVFANKRIRPDIEFLNHIRPEIKELLEKQKPWERIITEHTMYPYYSRFLDIEKREKAREALLGMGEADNPSAGQPMFSKLLSVPLDKEGGFCLRYCPFCVKEDRALYGETYWHRRHQIRGLSVCYRHGCALLKSSVAVSGKSSPDLRCAENEIIYASSKKADADLPATAGLKSFASYMVEVLEQSSFNQNDIGKMFVSKAKPSYGSARGKEINLSLLNNDLQSWKNRAGLCGGLTEAWQLGKLFGGYRKTPYDVCQMSYFLKVSPEEMIHSFEETMDSGAGCDDKVAGLIQSGKSIGSVSRELGVSTATVRKICREKNIKSCHPSWYSAEQKPKETKISEARKLWMEIKQKHPDMSYTALCSIGEYRPCLQYLRKEDKEWTDRHWFKGCKKKGSVRDWKKADEETLPLVRKAVRELLSEDRPQRISLYAVAKKIGVHNKIWDNLPKCRAEIKGCEIPKNEFWAMEVAWAVRKVRNEGKSLNWKSIRELTNMRKSNLQSCMKELEGRLPKAELELIGNMLH